MAKGQHLTPHQQRIVSRYYEHADTVAITKLQEAVSDLYLATTPKAAPDALLSWYRTEFVLPEPAKNVWIPWRAVLDASGNGMVALNGHELGRYWEVGPQREFYLPECWLKFGGEKNVLTIKLRSTERGAQLRAAEIAPYADQAERR